MEYKIAASWLASTDPDDLTGVATFGAGGRTYDIRLLSFEDFQRIVLLLRHAHTEGVEAAAADMKAAVVCAMKDRIIQIAPRLLDTRPDV